ncbi:hypothetical protein SLS57_005706 [Botryosphaeria dothidea]
MNPRPISVNPEMSGKSAQEAHGGTSDARVPSNPGEDTGLVDRTKNFGASGDAQFPSGESKLTGTETTNTSTGADNTSNPLSGTTSTSAASTSATSNPLSSSTPSATSGAAAAQGGAIRPEHDTAGTGVTSLHSNDPHGSDVRPTEAGTSSSKAGGFGAAEPSVSADPTSGQKPFQKQQGGDKPTAEPTSGAEVDKLKEKKDEGEEALKKKDPNDHSGEPLNVHEGGEKKQEQGSAGGEENSEEEKGTGEKYVKTSGFKADGGDFDASLPGAGREADRLLEQKGVHKSADSDAKKDDVSPARSGGSGEGKTKTSMGTKIKEKLHIGSKHKNSSD